MHVCPMVTVLVPHVGGPILPPGWPTVLIGGIPAARVTDLAVCAGGPDVIAMGAFTVLIGGLPAARMGDMTAHGGVIVQGEPTVMIGDVGAGGAGAPAAGGGVSAASPVAMAAATAAAHAGGGGGASGVTPEEQKALDDLGRLQGRKEAEIEQQLKKQGYSGPVVANSGGKIYTKDLGNGKTVAVRLDPAEVRTPPRGYADEVLHAHKETVPTSEVSAGNYSHKAKGKTRFDDNGHPSSDQRAVHIPISK